MNVKRFIIVDGAPGSGKSTWINNHSEYNIAQIIDTYEQHKQFPDTSLFFIETQLISQNLKDKILKDRHQLTIVMCQGAYVNYLAIEININELIELERVN